MDLVPDRNSLGPVKQGRHKNRAPCEVRLAEELELLREVREREGDEMYFLALGELAMKSYWTYLRLVCDYRFLDPWDHGEELIPFLEENIRENNAMLILMPRGSMKSASITVPILPWLIAKDPALPGLILNVREDKALKFARQASNIILSPVYQRCFPHVRPSTKWGEGGYYLQVDDAESHAGRVDPNIGGYGVGGNLAGSHVRALVVDDLINEKTYQYPNQLDMAEGFLKEAMNCLDIGGLFVNCATRWSFPDFYGKMEKGSLVSPSGPFKVFKRGAERLVQGRNGEVILEIFNKARSFIDFRGNQQQVGYKPVMLENYKKNLGALYYALYQNDPQQNADGAFDVSYVRDFTVPPFKTAGVYAVGVETESQSGAFFDALVKAIDQENRRSMPLRRLTSRHAAKNKRIWASIGPVINTGRLLIREDLISREGNIGEEIRTFQPDGHNSDDALDALTYAINHSPKHVEGQPPKVFIAVDPAFTNKSYSDHTAIVAGCWFQDEFWVLDCHKFKAAKADIIIRFIFRMYDKFNSGGRRETAKESVRTYYARGNAPAKTEKDNWVWGSNESRASELSLLEAARKRGESRHETE